MRTALILSLLLLSACESNNNPWIGVDYAEAQCGTPAAILTTTGCITTPPAGIVTETNRPISQPNDVGPSHNAPNSEQAAHGGHR